MTINELIELGSNPQKMQEYIKSKRNEELNCRIARMFLDITRALREQYNERLDGRYVYVNTFLSRIHIAYPSIDGFVILPDEIRFDKEKLSPLDAIREEEAKKAREKLYEEIGEACLVGQNFTYEFASFFHCFHFYCIRNNEPEKWDDIFDVICEEGFDNSLLVRINREYRHKYALILDSIDAEAQNYTWFS